MNFLGKIFIAMIFVLSIIFLGLATAIYATHRDLRGDVARTVEDAQKTGRPVGLKHQLADADLKNTQLRENIRRLRDELAEEEAAYRHQLQKLETRRVEMEDQKNRLTQEHDQLLGEKKSLTDAFEKVQKNADDVAKVVDRLRAEIVTTQEESSQNFDSAVALTEEINQKLGQLEQLEERHRQLKRQLAMHNEMTDLNAINRNAPPKDFQPDVRGEVVKVMGEGLIEISLGSDVGVQRGQTIEIYRGADYLGRAEIVRTQPDKAAATMLRDYQQDSIRRGDRVATRLHTR